MNSINFLECVISLSFSQTTVIRQDTEFTSRFGTLPATVHRLYDPHKTHKTQKMQSGPTERQEANGIDLCK